MKFFSKFFAGRLIVTTAMSAATAAIAVTISGADSTSVFPVYSKWAAVDRVSQA
ncbi:MAG TPA: hypothetical protein VGM72_02315 [Micropepsaceae bacterium]|jgi:ABC-type phosphate transport system substrate-binding protein